MEHTQPVNSILKKAVEKISFDRVKFQEKNVPTHISNVCCMILFGDIRSQFIASSMLVKRIKEELFGSKYFILCSWPGQKDMFPYVDEYWQPSEDSDLKTLYLQSNDFFNNSNICISYKRYLNSYLPEDILDFSVFEKFYNRGYQKEFFDRFGHIKLYLPSIPSSTVLGTELNKKLISKPQKVFIYPTTHIQNYKNGKITFSLITDDFWKELIDCLDDAGYSPIIYQDYLTHDLSVHFHDKYIFYKSEDYLNVLSLMRNCNYVLDVFSGISRMAIAARSPFVCCQDRNIFNFYKEYETDDLTSKDLPKEYVFTFPEVCDYLSKPMWKKSLFDVIIHKLDSMSELSRDLLPSPIAIDQAVMYSSVREIKKNKMGTRFIKVPKI